jgi:transcriptional regulator with XRE-family HTH domain
MNKSERNLENLAKNLRFLCNRAGTITAICRKIGLNRQQFNKYLSGKHFPSENNLRAIARYFGLNVSVLFSDPDEFGMLIEGNFYYVIERLQKRQHLRTFLDEVLLHTKAVKTEFLGVYDRYQYSSISEGSILRSTFCVYQQDDLTYHYYIERFPRSDNPSIVDHIFKYNGFTLPIAGQVICIDFETSQRNEITYSALTPIQRSSKRFLFGIASGIAASILRQPFATKVALQYQHDGLITRADLKHARLLAADDKSIPKEVLSFLGPKPDMIKIQ